MVLPSGSKLGDRVLCFRQLSSCPAEICGVYTTLRHLFSLRPLRSKSLLRPDSSDPIRQRGVQSQVLAITPKCWISSRSWGGSGGEPHRCRSVKRLSSVRSMTSLFAPHRSSRPSRKTRTDSLSQKPPPNRAWTGHPLEQLRCYYAEPPASPHPLWAQVSVQRTDANLGHPASSGLDLLKRGALS